MLLTAVACALLAVAAMAAMVWRIERAATRLPHDRPAVLIGEIASAVPGQKKKIVVCAGDSITHGRVSANYVDLLSKRLGSRGFRFVNAGINNELAWNLLSRVDEIARCCPDVVTVMIGTNDALSSLLLSQERALCKAKKLPRPSDSAWFQECLDRLCVELKARTNAQVILLSIPPLGENPGSLAWLRAVQYSAIIKSVAKAQEVGYLPLNEELCNQVLLHGRLPRANFSRYAEWPMLKAVWKRYALGRSWDQISAGQGLRFLTDLIHLNEAGAAIVAGLVERRVLCAGLTEEQFDVRADASSELL